MRQNNFLHKFLFLILTAFVLIPFSYVYATNGGSITITAPTTSGTSTINVTVQGTSTSGAIVSQPITLTINVAACSATSIADINGYNTTRLETNTIYTDDTHLIVYGAFSSSGNSTNLGTISYESSNQINILLSSLLSSGPHNITITNNCGNSSSFPFNVTAVSYTVTASAGAGGTISPTTTTVSQGGSAGFSVTPNSGYYISSVTGCNGSLSGNTYTTGAINANCSVSASFTLSPPVTYTVTGTAGANGSISPATQTVTSGNTASLTVTPNAGYYASASGCGGSLSGTTYTTSAITANCTVSASFSASPTPDLTASAPSPTTAAVNTATTLSATISNTGGASTLNSFFNFFQVATATNGGGTVTDLASTSMAALANGANATSTKSYTFPSAATYSTRICADKTSSGSSGTITESNENNNCSAWTNVTVSSSAVNGSCSSSHYYCNAGTSVNQVDGASWTWTCSGLNGGTNASCSEAKTSGPIDLTIIDFHLTDASGNTKTSFAPGESIYPSVTIKNNGTGATTSSTGVFYVSIFSNQSSAAVNASSDVSVWVKETGSIGAGVSKTYSIVNNSANWTNDSGNLDHWTKSSNGNYTALAFVDSWNYVNEGTNESNNQTTSAYAVTSTTVPTVVTGSSTGTAVVNITSNSATSGGNITSTGGSAVTVSGLVWSTSTISITGAPTLSTKTTDGWGTPGQWDSNMTGLAPDTPYHVRAYATNSAGTGYGADVTFTTLTGCTPPTTGVMTAPASAPVNSSFEITCDFGSAGDYVNAPVGCSWPGSNGGHIGSVATFACVAPSTAQNKTYTCSASNISGYTNFCSLPTSVSKTVSITAINNPPTGFLDSADCNAFVGWAKDPDDLNTPIDVHFYVGGTFVAQTNANIFRSDGGIGYHGFSFPTPSSLKDSVAHSIDAYGIDLSGGNNPLLSGSGKTITCVMSGTLTASDCTISAGASSCNSNLSWSTTNSVVTSAVTTPTNITVATGNSGSTTYPVSGGSPNGTRNFYLYNNGQLLDTKMATATCAAGTKWEDGKCVFNDAQYISQSVPTSMTAGQVQSVSITMKNIGNTTWTETSAYHLGSQNPPDNNTWGAGREYLNGAESIAPNQSKTFTFNITAPTTLGTYNFQWKMLREGVEWFGDLTPNVAITVTAAPVMSGTLSGSNCTIASGASSCTTNLSWSITNPEGTPTAITAVGMANINVTNTLATPQSGTQTVTVPYNSRIFYLYNNAKSLVPTSESPNGSGVRIDASCVSGTAWDIPTGKCAVIVGMSGTLSGPNCIIASGASSCNTTLTWNVSNPEVVGGSAVTSSYPSANTLVASGDSGSQSVSIPFNSRTFFLYNNAKSLVPTSESPNGSGVRIDASCVSGTAWDGSKCAVVAVNNAQYVSQSVPTSMTAGQVKSVSVTMKNTGNTTWTDGNAYRLGSQNPPDNNTWGTSRVSLNAGESIAPNQSKTFTFNITAPTTLGTYNFQWKMLRESVEWFGDLTSNVAITVTAAPVMSGTLTGPNCTIASGANSCTTNLSWSITNPEGTPTAITAAGMADINVTNTLATPQSGTQAVTVPYNSRTFYLYNNAKSLVPASEFPNGSGVTVTASCVSGTAWDSGTNSCQTIAGMSGTLTGPNCTIASGANSCNTTITWTTTNPEATSAVTSSYPSANTVVANGNSGSQSVSIPYNSRTFFLYNNAKSLVPTSESPNGSGVRIDSSCVSGTNWDGSSCASSPAPTASCSVSPNPLPNGGNPGITLSSTNASYCYVYHDWSYVAGPATDGNFNSGTFYPGVQTVPGTHQGEVFCYNSDNVGMNDWVTCDYTVNPVIGGSVTLYANPVTIIQGNSSTLTWTGSGSCAGTNFNTGGASSGSQSVSPTSTVTYSVDCDNGSASATVTVKKKPIFIEN